MSKSKRNEPRLDDLAKRIIKSQRIWYERNRDKLRVSNPDNDLRLVRCFNWLAIRSSEINVYLIHLWLAFCALYVRGDSYSAMVTKTRVTSELNQFCEFAQKICKLEAAEVSQRSRDKPRRLRGSRKNWLEQMTENHRDDMITLADCKYSDRRYMLAKLGKDWQSNNAKNRNRANGGHRSSSGKHAQPRNFDDQHEIEVRRFSGKLNKSAAISPTQLTSLLRRIYFLRGHIVHGVMNPSGADDMAMIAACRILQAFLAVTLQVILEHPDRDWGPAPQFSEAGSSEVSAELIMNF